MERGIPSGVFNIKEYAQRSRGLPTSNPNRLPTPDKHLRSETLHTTHSPLKIRIMKTEGMALGKENKEKLRQLEEENAILSRDNLELSKALSNLKKQNELLASQSQLHISDPGIQDKIRRSKLKKRSFRDNIDRISKELQNKASELEDWRRKYFDLESSLRISGHQGAHSSSEVEDLKKTISNLRNNLSKVESDKQNLARDNSVLASGISQKPKKINISEREIRSGKDSGFAAEERLRILIEEMEILISDKTHLENDLHSANSQIQRLKHELDMERSMKPINTINFEENLQSQSRRTYLDPELTQKKDEEIRELRTQLNTLRTQLHDPAPHISYSPDSQLINEISELKRQMETHKHREKELEGRLRNYEGSEFELKNTKFLIEQKGSELEKVNEDKWKLEKRLNQVLDELDLLNTENNKLHNEIKKHQVQLNEFQKSNRDLSSNLHSASKFHEEEVLRNREFREKLNEKDLQISKLEGQQKKEVSELKWVISQLQNQNKILEEKLLDLLQATEENMSSKEKNEEFEAKKLLEIQQIRSHLHSLTGGNAELLENQFKIERKMYEKTIDQLKGQISELEQQINWKTEQKSTLIKKVTKSNLKDSTVKHLEEQIHLIKENLNAALQQKQQLDSQNNALQNIIDNQAQYLKDLKYSMEECKERNDLLAKTLHEIKVRGTNELDIASEAEDRLIQELETIQRERDQLRFRADSSEREIVNMNRQLNEKMREIDQLKHKYYEMINELKTFQDMFSHRVLDQSPIRQH